MNKMFEKEAQKSLKAQYEKQMEKFWKTRKGDTNDKMVKYCVGKADVLVMSRFGLVWEIDKESIDTNFCFGWGMSQSFEDAVAEENAFGAKEFVEKNMRNTMQYLNWFKEALDEINMYGSQNKVFWSFNNERIGVSTAMNWEREMNRDWLTAEDLELVVEAWEIHKANREKQIERYLKRYGVSKCNTWTYWDMD